MRLWTSWEWLTDAIRKGKIPRVILPDRYPLRHAF
jgi:hypothetical protein